MNCDKNTQHMSDKVIRDRFIALGSWSPRDQEEAGLEEEAEPVRKRALHPDLAAFRPGPDPLVQGSSAERGRQTGRRQLSSCFPKAFQRLTVCRWYSTFLVRSVGW